MRICPAWQQQNMSSFQDFMRIWLFASIILGSLGYTVLLAGEDIIFFQICQSFPRIRTCIIMLRSGRKTGRATIRNGKCENYCSSSKSG